MTPHLPISRDRIVWKSFNSSHLLHSWNNGTCEVDHVYFIFKKQMQNLLPIPDELLQTVYLYDPTFHDVYDVVMDEILIRARLQEERREFLMEQELELNVFELNASLYLADLLGQNIY
jgi:hypothetical protein